MNNAHIDSVMLLAKPFQEDAIFDFGVQTITQEMQDLVGIMLKERLEFKLFNQEKLIESKRPIMLFYADCVHLPPKSTAYIENSVVSFFLLGSCNRNSTVSEFGETSKKNTGRSKKNNTPKINYLNSNCSLILFTNATSQLLLM